MAYDSPDTDRKPQDEITLNVKHHPKVQAKVDAGQQVWLHASLAVKIDVPVARDLHQGDKLLVTVMDQDGELLSRAYAEVKPVTFQPIEDKDHGYLGTERCHKAVQTDELVQDQLPGL